MYGIEGLLAGRTLVGRYRVDEVIGRGGMGAVYRARDERLGREVAVKVVTVAAPDPAAHRRLRTRFHREAKAAAALHHPNIVAVYDFGTDPELELDFLVMELLRGEDLANRLAHRGPPSLPVALSVLYQAARGLAAGHRAGLIHRDVKPGNLFLEPGDRAGDVRAKVLDFGIADIGALDDATVTQLTVAGKSPFSPAFASPEQLRGESRLTPATDVFSLAATGFQLLTGQRVFTSSEPRQMVVELSRSLADTLPRVPGLPPEVRSILRKALSPFAEDRFPDAGAFADALGGVLGGETDPALSREPEHTPRTTPVAAEAPRRERGTAGGTRLAELESIRPRAVQAAPGAGGRVRRPFLRRAAAAMWDFVVTVASVALFAGAWFLAVQAFQEGDQNRVYMAGAASVFLTPLAVHRLMGRRGSLRLALFGSLLGSAAVVYFLGPEQPLERVLGAVFLVQVVLSFGAERATRRPAADPFA